VSKYPGVYIEEFSPPPPIHGVSTSITGFVGAAAHGPQEPTTVQSLAEHQRRFGDGGPPGTFLADAVRGFFDNGGRRASLSAPAARSTASASSRRFRTSPSSSQPTRRRPRTP
jgi:hypothetical protein